MKRYLFPSIYMMASAIALFSSTSLFSQAKKAQPPEDLSRLISLIAGHWEGSGTLSEGGQISKLSFVLEEKSSLNGWAIQGWWKSDNGTATTTGTDLWGFDDERTSIHWFSVTDKGETHDHMGKWSGSKLAMQYTSSSGGKDYVEDVIFDFSGKDKLRWKWEIRIAGVLEQSYDITLKRAETPKPPVKKTKPVKSIPRKGKKNSP